MPHPLYSPNLVPGDYFFVSLDEKSPQRETFCICGRGETKNGRSTKRHQNRWVQKPLSSGKNILLGAAHCTKWRESWNWLKFKHVRINMQLFINKFWVGGPPCIQYEYGCHKRRKSCHLRREVNGLEGIMSDINQRKKNSARSHSHVELEHTHVHAENRWAVARGR